MRDAAPAAPPRSAAADRALARAEPPGQAKRADAPSFEDALARTPRAEAERPRTPPGGARKAERAEPAKAAGGGTETAKPGEPGEEASAPTEQVASAIPTLSPDLLAAIAAAAAAPDAEGATEADTDVGVEKATFTDGMAQEPSAVVPLPAALATMPAAPLPRTAAPSIGGPTVIDAAATPPPPEPEAPAVEATSTAQAPAGLLLANTASGAAATAPPDASKADPAGTAAGQMQGPQSIEAKAAPEPPKPAPPEVGAEQKTEPPADAKRAGPPTDAQAPRDTPSLPPGLDALARAQGPAGAASAAVASPAPSGPPLPVLQNVPIGAVPVEIGLKSLAGMNRFEIRLDPGDLGRIDVTLEIGETGDVKARLVVDRVETLALLQRDARTLERAFEQAGLKAGDGSVDLQLRDGGSGSRSEGRGEHGRENRPGHPPDPSEGRQPLAPPPQARPIWRGTAGIDVRI